MPSSDVRDGVVKTFRCRSLAFRDFDVHVLPAPQDPDDLDRIISFDVEYDMVGEILDQSCPQPGKLRNTGLEWPAAFGKQRQAFDRLLSSFEKP